MAKRKNLKVHGWVRIKASAGDRYAGKEGIILSIGPSRYFQNHSIVVAISVDDQVRRLTFSPNELKRLS
jgi:hypothetical protein